jgi:DNA-binding NtrC family response regulator
MKTIFIVDDMQDYLQSLERVLARKWNVICAMSLCEAQEKLQACQVDVALIDIRLSTSDQENRDGIVLLRWLKERDASISVIIMSGFQDFDSAVDAINLGAIHFLKKPIYLPELDKLLGEITEDKALRL